MIEKINNDPFDEYDVPDRYRADCLVIQQVLLNHGYTSDIQDCYELWSDYSDRYAAGWINLPDKDDEIWSCISFSVEQRCR